jgi:hypothetical protein
VGGDGRRGTGGARGDNPRPGGESGPEGNLEGGGDFGRGGKFEEGGGEFKPVGRAITGSWEAPGAAPIAGSGETAPPGDAPESDVCGTTRRTSYGLLSFCSSNVVERLSGSMGTASGAASRASERAHPDLKRGESESAIAENPAETTGNLTKQCDACTSCIFPKRDDGSER